jgi:ATP-dependent helicase/nuclease subunit B
VDRIDSFSDGEDTFVKVIDYKSSAHDLDAAEIYYGLSLQLLIYMGIGLKVCGEKEKAALPGAAFYFKMDDPMVEGNRQNAGERLVEQINALKPQGIYLDDARVLSALDDGSDKAIQAFMKTASNKKKIRDYSRQDFEALIHFAEHHVTEGAKAILAGDIGVRPYKLGNDSSCTFCDYRGICGYDAQIDRQACRQLEKVKRETLIEKATALTTEAAEDQKEQDNAMDD